MSKNICSKEHTSKKTRERKCLVSGKIFATYKMIRFVVDPQGNVIPDVAGKLPGRGGWILADRRTLECALKKRIFVRFGHRVMTSPSRRSLDMETLDEPGKETIKSRNSRFMVDENLPEMTERLLCKRCLNYLGLVNRAGLLVSGFEKVRAVLKADNCRALISAKDAAKGGRSKLSSGTGNVLDKLRMIDMFTRGQLGQTLGLPNAVHVALLPGEMTESFLRELSRYEGVVMQ